MTKEQKAFYSGIRTALAILAIHDQETIFREVVDACDEDELVAAARADGEMEFSGLSRYGYGRRRRKRAQP